MNKLTEDFRSAKTNFTARAGLPTGPVPTEPYRSAAYFELEREKIFKRAWLCIGRVERLPEPGSFIVEQIEIAQTSILITRTKDGSIKAFYNVCSHRSNTLVLEREGTASRFVCSYHNWTYRDNGDLIGVPDAANFFELDKKCYGLTPVACDVWEGWIFINLQPEPEVGLAEFLGDFGERYRQIPYPHAKDSILFVSHLNANWKVIADAFAETYHLPAVHSKTVAPTFVSNDNPFARPISNQVWGPHRQMSTYGNPDYSPPENAKVEQLAYSKTATGNVISAAGLDDMEVLLRHPEINPTKSENWSLDSNWLFPNFQLDIGPGGFWTHHFWPITHNTTRWEARFHVPVAGDVWTRLQQEHFIARMAEILLEDVGNTERTQFGLDSGAKQVMPLQDAEVMIRHSLHHIQKWIDADTVREALG